MLRFRDSAAIKAGRPIPYVVVFALLAVLCAFLPVWWNTAVLPAFRWFGLNVGVCWAAIALMLGLNVLQVIFMAATWQCAVRANWVAPNAMPSALRSAIQVVAMAAALAHVIFAWSLCINLGIFHGGGSLVWLRVVIAGTALVTVAVQLGFLLIATYLWSHHVPAVFTHLALLLIIVYCLTPKPVAAGVSWWRAAFAAGWRLLFGLALVWVVSWASRRWLTRMLGATPAFAAAEEETRADPPLERDPRVVGSSRYLSMHHQFVITSEIARNVDRWVGAASKWNGRAGGSAKDVVDAALQCRRHVSGLARYLEAHDRWPFRLAAYELECRTFNLIVITAKVLGVGPTGGQSPPGSLLAELGSLARDLSARAIDLPVAEAQPAAITQQMIDDMRAQHEELGRLVCGDPSEWEAYTLRGLEILTKEAERVGALAQIEGDLRSAASDGLDGLMCYSDAERRALRHEEDLARLTRPLELCETDAWADSVWLSTGREKTRQSLPAIEEFAACRVLKRSTSALTHAFVAGPDSLCARGHGQIQRMNEWRVELPEFPACEANAAVIHACQLTMPSLRAHELVRAAGMVRQARFDLVPRVRTESGEP